MLHLEIKTMQNNQETEPLPQRPDINVAKVEQGEQVGITSDMLPWLTDADIELHTVRVTTLDGLTFNYGSVVKGNHSIEHIASQVTAKDSEHSEEAMFKSLPYIFDGKMPPNIDRVHGVDAAWPIFKVAKKGPDAPRLFFAWFRGESGEPVVLKLAIAKHKKQDETYAVMQGRGSHRKRDGRNR